LRIRFKVWLEKEGEPIISEGKFRLLKEVERTGSIQGAAKNLGLTYKRAISQIKTMEKRLGRKVLERKRGRGARLTEAGRDLLRRYEAILRRFTDLAKELEGNPQRSGGPPSDPDPRRNRPDPTFPPPCDRGSPRGKG
jgi:molybdate transport system regulatory protein